MNSNIGWVRRNEGGRRASQKGTRRNPRWGFSRRDQDPLPGRLLGRYCSEWRRVERSIYLRAALKHQLRTCKRLTKQPNTGDLPLRFLFPSTAERITSASGRTERSTNPVGARIADLNRSRSCSRWFRRLRVRQRQRQ